MPAETGTRSSDDFQESTMTADTLPPRHVSIDAPVPDTRRIAALVGSMFLTGTVTFMLGDRLISSAFESSPSALDADVLTTGVGLIAACGVAVAVIGVALYRVLRRFHRGLAWAQMVFRLLECAAIWGVGGFMLATHDPVPYEVATYAFTGTAGLISTYALGRHGLIPGRLARLGIVGYVAIALTVPAELLDVVSLDSPAGMLLYLPGAAFELILPVLLITRGFRPVGADLGTTRSTGRPA